MKIKEAKRLVEGFENGSLSKKEWSHHAHFVMALWYCFHLPLTTAIHTIRNGIKKYNESVGGQNTDESGYHETITFFYIHAIAQYIISNGSESLEKLLEKLDEQCFLQRDFPLNYYSRDLLMSRQARRQWVYPDKKSFCMESMNVLTYDA